MRARHREIHMKKVSYRIICGLAVAALAVGSSAMGAEKKKGKKGKKDGSAEVVKAPWGMAGCGLGALVIDRNETLPQLAAYVLNYLVYSNNTFGMTSGTSNCVES